MKDQENPNLEGASASEPSLEDSDATAKGKGLGAYSGYLPSRAFWSRLGLGVLILGAGVLIGLGVDRFDDEDRGVYENGSHDGNESILKADGPGKWVEEGRLSRGRHRLRFYPTPGKGHGRSDERKGWSEGKGLPGRQFGDRDGIYIPYGLLEEHIERIAARVEGLIDKVEGYLEEGGFGSEGGLGDWFSSRAEGRGDKGESWRNNRDGYDASGDDNSAKGADPSEDGQDGARGPSGGPGFPFGEFLPGLAFLDECELDFEDLFSMMEDFEGSDVGELGEGEEGFEELFKEVEELLTQACETPPDN